MQAQRDMTEHKVVDYKLVYGGTPEFLAQNVCDEFEYGWKPIGGVSVIERDRGGKLEFFQAIVRTEG